MLPFEKTERTIVEKRKAKTDSKFGSEPDSRPIKELLDFGVITINKPKGPTSHQVSAYVQKILNINKAGHGGTLDPRVTGVLPIAIGRGTRIVQTLLPAGKEYVCIMHIHKPVEPSQIKEVMKKFIGTIKQLPPIKSAVKRQVRDRKIYYLDILEIDKQDVLFRVGCEAGTYIRKLCTDIGKKLKTGAHMAELIRTKAGPFNDKEMYTMQELTDAFAYYKEGNEKYIRKIIKPLEFAVSHLPKIWVLDSAIDSISHGADLKVPGIAKLHDPLEQEQLVAVMSLKDELVGIGRAKLSSKELIKEEKGIAVVLHKVFMLVGTYPKITD
jgi:H/ACA ribonucleoprotein complex subunit 4